MGRATDYRPGHLSDMGQDPELELIRKLNYDLIKLYERRMVSVDRLDNIYPYVLEVFIFS